jgi:hypothetical protein
MDSDGYGDSKTEFAQNLSALKTLADQFGGSPHAQIVSGNAGEVLQHFANSTGDDEALSVLKDSGFEPQALNQQTYQTPNNTDLNYSVLDSSSNSAQLQFNATPTSSGSFEYQGEQFTLLTKGMTPGYDTSSEFAVLNKDGDVVTDGSFLPGAPPVIDMKLDGSADKAMESSDNGWVKDSWDSFQFDWQSGANSSMHVEFTANDFNQSSGMKAGETIEKDDQTYKFLGRGSDGAGDYMELSHPAFEDEMQRVYVGQGYDIELGVDNRHKGEFEQL